MSNLITGRIFKHSKTKSNDRLMMLCIGDNADDYGHAWPGMGLLADKMGNNSRTTAAVRIDVLAQTNELGVYPVVGSSHHYLVLTGMTFGEARDAIKRLAKRLKMSITDLARLRRKFQKEAAARITARRDKKSKKGDTPSIHPLHDTPTVQVGDTPADQQVTPQGVHEPSLTIIEPPVEPAGAGETDVFKLLNTVWGQMVSGLTEMEMWQDLEALYPIEWIKDAMVEAIENGGGTKKSIKYIRVILERWKAEGREVKKSSNNTLPPISVKLLTFENEPVITQADRDTGIRLIEEARRAKRKSAA